MMLRTIYSSASLFLIFLALTGLGYPLLTLGIGQAVFPYQANGSLMEENGQIIG
jgi:K+-transporting ATPase ATPase C chain